jgi:hypothetical protein
VWTDLIRSQVIPLTNIDAFDFEQIGEPKVQYPKSCVHLS